MVKSTCIIPTKFLDGKGYSGEQVRDGIILANEFAYIDPYRAATHNKGIMNGIDAVAIATPAGTHYNLAKRCLLAGKHVFVEKPLALTEKEGRDLIKTAEEKRLTLMVGHILHYHQAVIKLKELIDSGELGKIQYLYYAGGRVFRLAECIETILQIGNIV